MSRPYRLQAEDTLYHVISRGNDRQKIYLTDSDYLRYLKYLETAKEKFGFYLYAYVLMTNHVHLLIETSQPNISRVMQYVNSAYTTYFNLKHKKTGHLFQGRYKSIVVDKDAYLLELSRYIHLNPVRAGMVKNPADYPWSSYGEYVKRAKTGLISRDKLKHYMDYSPAQYREFVAGGIGVRVDFKDKVYGGFILGRKQFIRDTLNELKTAVENKDITHAKDIISPHSMDEVLEWYCGKKRINEGVICQAKKKRSAEKKEAIYLIKRLTGHTNGEIGDRFGISDSAVSKAAGAVEKEMLEDKRMKKGIEGIISSFKV